MDNLFLIGNIAVAGFVVFCIFFLTSVLNETDEEIAKREKAKNDATETIEQPGQSQSEEIQYQLNEMREVETLELGQTL